MMPAFRMSISNLDCVATNCLAQAWTDLKEVRSHWRNVIWAFGTRVWISLIAARALDSVRAAR